MQTYQHLKFLSQGEKVFDEYSQLQEDIGGSTVELAECFTEDPHFLCTYALISVVQRRSEVVSPNQQVEVTCHDIMQHPRKHRRTRP